MVLGKLPVSGRPICIIVGQGLTALALGAGGVVWTFSLSSITSLFFLPVWETARYRLKYCLKGPLNPNQPNQPFLPALQPFHRLQGWTGCNNTTPSSNLYVIVSAILVL